MIWFVLLAFALDLSRGLETNRSCGSNAIVNHDYHRKVDLSLSASVLNDKIVLSCLTQAPHFLTFRQYLKWTEKGRVIDSSTTNGVVLNVTSTGATLIITNATHLHYGSYTCRCYNSYTVSEIQDIFHNEDLDYHHYCSEPVTIKATPSLMNITIYDHVVSNRSEHRKIECSERTNVLVNAVSGSTINNVPFEVIVDSVSKQGKYTCINNLTKSATEIHYVSIKDYELPVFLIPKTSDAQITIDGIGGNVPVCAVHSTIPLISMTDSFENFRMGQYYQTKNHLYFNTLGGIFLKAILNIQHHNYCSIKTQWETVNFTDYNLKPKTIEAVYVPNACVETKLISMDSSSYIESGSSFVISCSVITNDSLPWIVEVVHVSSGSSMTILDRKYNVFNNYRTTVHNASDSSIGIYYCVFISSAYSVSFNSSVTIDEIWKMDTITVTDYAVYPSSSSFEAQTMTVNKLKLSFESVVPDPPNTSSYISSASESQLLVLTSVVNTQPSAMFTTVIVVFSTVGFVMILSILLTLLLVIYYKKSSKHKGEVVYGMNEVDRVSIWSFNETIDGRYNEEKISERMQKCTRELIASHWYIPYDKLWFHERLGAGAFGKVKKAEMFGINSSPCISNVAVKMLKDDAGCQDEKDIIAELKMLQSIGSHKNIVGFYGASIHDGQLLLIVEYCSGGDLLRYLRKVKSANNNTLTVTRQVDMAKQVACGMEYLSSKKCVHRDLAARNVLISEDGTLKVSDFGLARQTHYYMYKMTREGKIPFKWMAPESILYKEFTSNSDVWSFGVLFWEIMSFGWTPYPGKSVEEVNNDLQNRKLMQRPPSCPVVVFDFILMCWRFEPDQRPTFSSLVNMLENFDHSTVAEYYSITDNVTEPTSVNTLLPQSQRLKWQHSLTTNLSISQSANSSSQDNISDIDEIQASDGGYITCGNYNTSSGTPTTKTKTSLNTISVADSTGYVHTLYKHDLQSNSDLHSDVFTDSELEESDKCSSCINGKDMSSVSDSGLSNNYACDSVSVGAKCNGDFQCRV